MNSKTQVQFANEGAEKKQKEEEVAARKRKLEEKEKWEGKSLPTFFYLLHFKIRKVESYHFSCDRFSTERIFDHLPHLYR